VQDEVNQKESEQDEVDGMNKKAQLSLTNPRDAKPCQKLL